MIYYCQGCDNYFHPPAPLCPTCWSDEVVARPVSGKGSVLTFTVNHQKWQPDLSSPYVIAIIELQESSSLKMLSNVVNCDPDSVKIGMPVKVTFINQEDVWVPVFEEDN